MNKLHIKVIGCGFLLLAAALLNAQSLQDRRAFEPQVVKGQLLTAALGQPVDSLHLYAFDGDNWQLMPFQIDEPAKSLDLFRLPDSVLRWSYFYADDGLLDGDDELVFMIRDMGKKAEAHQWPDDANSRSHERIEIAVSDGQGDAVYAYLYQSDTMNDPVPTPYDLSYDKSTHTVQSLMYTVRMDSTSGIIRDIAVKAPWGSGEDFFDTQKMRFVGLMDVAGVVLPIGRDEGVNAANERDVLYVFPESDAENLVYNVTANPVVRLIREVRQTIRFGRFVLDGLSFYVEAHFYPYSGSIEGGTSLDPDSLKAYYGGDEDVYIELDVLRQSWDFNERAAGMVYHNDYNDSIPVDGATDDVDVTLDKPVDVWGLTTGAPGALFTHTAFADTGWQTMSLYYRDDLTGGQSDGTFIDEENGDTGDGKSYGDYGTLFQNLSQRAVDLDLGFTAYFLPAGTQRSVGEQLFENILNPAQVSTAAASYISAVEEQNGRPGTFSLLPNYPNPFNGITRIPIEVGRTGELLCEIIDCQGRMVREIENRRVEAGRITLSWDGRDANGLQTASGVYFIRCRMNDDIKIHKTLYLK